MHLVDVVKDANTLVRLLSGDYAHIHELLLKENREGLAALVHQCEQAGLTVTSEVASGTTSQATIEAARRTGADLIIRSAKGARSLTQGPLGASAQNLLQRPPCPVWLVQSAQPSPLKQIVAAVDATPNDEPHARLNRRIIQTAIELTKQDNSQLLIVYAWSLFSAEMLSHRLPPAEYQLLMESNRQQHAESFNKLLEEFQLHLDSPQVRLIEGEPSTCIPGLCTEERADLFICGTVARQGMAGLLLGNTAERILTRVPCSALAMTPA